MPTISATTRSALPSITFTSKALRSPITRFCSIFTLRRRQSASGLGAGRPRGVDREGLCVGRNGRHGYPHTRKAAPPAADRLGVLLHLINSLVPHDVLMKTIERFWTEVMPRVARRHTPIGAPIRGKTRRQARSPAALHPSAKPPNVSSPGLLSITCKSFAATVNSAAQAH